jgi:hypothetical protein
MLFQILALGISAPAPNRNIRRSLQSTSILSGYFKVARPNLATQNFDSRLKSSLVLSSATDISIISQHITGAVSISGEALSVTILDSCASDLNAGGSSGGVLRIQNVPTVLVSWLSVSNCQATEGGAFWFHQIENLTITTTEIVNCSSSKWCAGLWVIRSVYFVSQLHVENCSEFHDLDSTAVAFRNSTGSFVFSTIEGTQFQAAKQYNYLLVCDEPAGDNHFENCCFSSPNADSHPLAVEAGEGRFFVDQIVFSGCYDGSDLIAFTKMPPPPDFEYVFSNLDDDICHLDSFNFSNVRTRIPASLTPDASPTAEASLTPFQTDEPPDVSLSDSLETVSLFTDSETEQNGIPERTAEVDPPAILPTEPPVQSAQEESQVPETGFIDSGSGTPTGGGGGHVVTEERDATVPIVVAVVACAVIVFVVIGVAWLRSRRDRLAFRPSMEESAHENYLPDRDIEGVELIHIGQL